MPKPGDSSRGALEHLDKKLEAFDVARKATPFATGMGDSASDGYRLLGQMLSGVLGGLGLGWLFDHFVHTSPWGLVSGLLIGAGMSIYATVRTASAISARAAAKSAPARSVPDDDEDDG